MARLGRRATSEERLRICRLIEAGETPDAVAERHGFGRSTVFGWWQAYRREGAEALRTKRTPGPKANLGTPQLGRLRSLVVEDLRKGAPHGPVLHTRKSVQRLIQREFRVRLSPVSVGRVLDRIALPLVSPLARAKEAETEGSWPAGTLGTVRAATAEGMAVHYVWIEPLRPFHPEDARWRDGRPGIVISSIGDSREVRFRAVVGVSPSDAFLHMCQAIAERTSRATVVVAESGDATCAAKVTRFFAATGGQLSLLLLPSRGGWSAPPEHYEEAVADGLACGDNRSTLVTFNDDRGLDAVDLELALRSLHRRLPGPRRPPGGAAVPPGGTAPPQLERGGP